MSKLYLTENGNVIPLLCEELTNERRARKILELPLTGQPVHLYICIGAGLSGLLDTPAPGSKWCGNDTVGTALA